MLILSCQEIFDIGDEDNKTHGKNIFYPESMFPGLREFSLRAHRELHEVCMNNLEAFLLGLSLTESEKNDIRDIHSGGNDHLRLLHYPSLPSSIVEIETNGRFQPHQDWRQVSDPFVTQHLPDQPPAPLPCYSRIRAADLSSKTMPKRALLYLPHQWTTCYI